MLSYERRHLAFRTWFHRRPSGRPRTGSSGLCALLLLSDPGTMTNDFLLLSDTGAGTDVLQLLSC